MLFTSRAITSRINAPPPTGNSAYMKPRLWIFSPPMTAMRAVAPPGGKVTEGGRPEDVAYAALYLASDEARLVSGAAIPLDGAADL